MSDVTLLAKITTLPGKRDEVAAIFTEMVGAVESEAGTKVYAMHLQADDEVTVWFYERYTDQDALAAHGTSEAMKATGGKLKGLLAGRPELIFMTPVVAKGV